MIPIRSSTTRTLYANGCSFTAGSELEQDDGPGSAPPGLDPEAIAEYQRRHAWPGVLGEIAEIDIVVNEALGAGSNARAVRMTIGFVAGYLGRGGDPRDLLVCIGITDLKRFERYEEEGEAGPPDGDGGEGWRLVKPRLSGPNAQADRQTLKANRLYYRYLYSERQAVASLVGQILLLQSVLDANGIAYHLHDAMGSNREALTRWLPVTPEAGLVDADRYALAGVEGGHGSFEQWALANGFATGRHGHPLLKGHRGWAAVLLGELEASGQLERGRSL